MLENGVEPLNGNADMDHDIQQVDLGLKKSGMGLNRTVNSHWFNGHDSGTDLLEVPTINIRPIVQAYVRGYAPKIWPYMVLTYLHFRILEFPLTGWLISGGKPLKNQVPSGKLTVCELENHHL